MDLSRLRKLPGIMPQPKILAGIIRQKVKAKYQQRVLARDALASVLEQLHLIEKIDNSPFKRSPNPGYLRGIDFYTKDDLVLAMCQSFVKYRIAGGNFPNLVSPETFNEKLNWRKFFGELKIPETGNKLLTSNFIPPSLVDKISCPTIVWHSPSSLLPRNDEINPGIYYLKASHGSNMFRRIVYPMSDKARSGLERICASWLQNSFGMNNGEWFYNAFAKELLIEEAVCDDELSYCLCCHVFNGTIEYISAYQKYAGGESSRYFDRNFNLYRYQSNQRKAFNMPELSQDTVKNIVLYAEVIGSQFDAARVDFILGRDEKIFLNELTFTSNAGMPFGNPELDALMGEKWKFVHGLG